MNTAVTDIKKAIVQRMATNWTTTPIVYTNMPYEPQGSTDFVFFNVNMDDASQAALNIGTVLYRHLGAIEIDIFTETGKGEGLGIRHMDTISDIFRGQSFGDVVCFGIMPLTAGERTFSTGKFWSTPFFCPFQADIQLTI